MGKIETRSKTPAEVSSPSTENAKPRGSKQKKKGVKEALKAGEGRSEVLLKGVRENRVGVSSNGNGGLGDDVVVEVVKSRLVETKISIQREMGDRDVDILAANDCLGLADSEINGVSSLLKMRESGRSLIFSYGGGSESAEKLDSVYGYNKRAMAADVSSGGGSLRVDLEERKERGEGKDNDENHVAKIVTIDVPIAETSDSKDAELEDVSEEGYGFDVGDFVWGKIKSHPWWPGRIYDPLDASDYALKLRLKNRVLVAYFGDRTFAWCHPSQLKPFEENFNDMVKQSSSRAFVNAVQEAVNEVGRLLDLKMSTLFVAKKSGTEFAPPLAKNSGIKDGILVPEDGIEGLSSVLSDPSDLLFRVKQIAQIIAITSVLELEILRARLSAFYLWRGGYKLPTYQVPQPIPGLEGSLMDETVDTGNSKGAVEAPVKGPFEEDLYSLPVSLKFGETSHSPGISGNMSHHRRKQKSIAEIMGEDNDVHAKRKEGDLTEEVNSDKSIGSSGRKKMKSSEDTMATKSVQKRKGLPPNTDINVPITEHDGNGGKENIDKSSLKTSEDTVATKPVQKRKGLPPNTDINVPITEHDGSEGKENIDKSSLLRSKRKKETVGSESNSTGSRKETVEAPLLKDLKLTKKEAEEHIEKGSFSRERKKSKYLSPPFITPSKGQRKRDIEAESLQVSREARLSEQITRAAGQLVGSPTLKFSGEACVGNFSKEPEREHELSGSSNSETPEADESKAIDPMKIRAPSEEVLSQVRSTAINPQIPRKNNSLEKIVGFISIFRSSIYRQGSYYKVYKKQRPGGKRKNLESEPGMLRKDQNQTEHVSPNHDSEQRKKRRKKDTALDTPKQKRTAESKTGKKESDESATAAALFVSFGPGSSLPSKSDLITMYSKFGALNEAETDMFCANYTARVCFLRTSDAEKAFSYSQNSSPFGSSNVNFRLRYLSTRSKSREHVEKSRTKASPTKKKDNTPAKASTPEPSSSEASKLNFIKEKLQALTKMLEASDGKSPDMKTTLKTEMKGLLEAVNKMVESSSS